MTLSQKALRVFLEIRHQSVGLSNRAFRENFWSTKTIKISVNIISMNS